MYLSKIMIKGAACRNPYEIHRILWNLFPSDADAQRDYLFRVERMGQQQAEILLQSQRKPECATRDASLLATREYVPRLRSGQRLRFMIIGNPVKTIQDESGRLNRQGEVKKCRVPLIRDEEWRQWLERKLAGCAELETLIAEKRLPMNFRKAKERRVGKIQPVRFQGVLKVENEAALMDLIENGIGPAKGFGCGMLSLARA